MIVENQWNLRNHARHGLKLSQINFVRCRLLKRKERKHYLWFPWDVCGRYTCLCHCKLVITNGHVQSYIFLKKCWLINTSTFLLPVEISFFFLYLPLKLKDMNTSCFSYIFLKLLIYRTSPELLLNPVMETLLAASQIQFIILWYC